MMRWLLQVCLLVVLGAATVSLAAGETETSLNRAIDAKWAECRSAIYKNDFKGGRLFEEDTYLSEDDLVNREKYFEVPKSAVEKFIISKEGQVAYALYWQDLLCVGDLMNNYCGSSGCSYNFVVYDKIYELHGGRSPHVVDAGGTSVVLFGRSGDHCETSKTASCFKAYVWDDQWKQFNTPGGHRVPIK